MADTPTLSAYCVSLFFENQVALAAIVAGSEAEAAAQVSVQIARQHDKPLIGIGVMRIEAEWMRFALKTLESAEVHKAPVVSLVSDNLRPAPQNRIWCHQHNHSVPCPTCFLGTAEPVPRCLEHGSAIPCPACASEYNERWRHLMPAEAPDPA